MAWNTLRRCVKSRGLAFSEKNLKKEIIQKLIRNLMMESFFFRRNLIFTQCYFLSSLGLSCKTQEIYLIVFCMRYIDLFMYYISLYNTLMKIFFISSSALIIYLMRFKKPFCTVSTFRNILDFFHNDFFNILDLRLTR